MKSAVPGHDGMILSSKNRYWPCNSLVLCTRHCFMNEDDFVFEFGSGIIFSEIWTNESHLIRLKIGICSKFSKSVTFLNSPIIGQAEKLTQRKLLNAISFFQHGEYWIVFVLLRTSYCFVKHILISNGVLFLEIYHVQGGWGGCRTGNGKKVSNSQACCLTQLCLAAA